MADTETRIRPFSNGTQYGDWEGTNCARCTKWSDDASTCPLQQALTLAYMGDGTISGDEAKRIGYDSSRYVWPCPEKEWDGTFPPAPPSPLERLEAELAHALEKVDELTEKAAENADWPEESAPWPSGPWGDVLVDLALVHTTLIAARERLAEANQASGPSREVPGGENAES